MKNPPITHQFMYIDLILRKVIEISVEIGLEARSSSIEDVRFCLKS